MTVINISASAQSFDELWKKSAEADSKDLPKEQMAVLAKIRAKAEKERAYGHLLKAELITAQRQYAISPDSLPKEVEALERKMQLAEAYDKTLAAVYKFVVGRIYQIHDGKTPFFNYRHGSNVGILGDGAKEKGDKLIDEALADPALLAAHKDKEYVPLVELGEDSKIFDHDLLSVMCMEAERYDVMARYYDGRNNEAALLASLEVLERSDDNYQVSDYKKSEYIRRIDSLISKYHDLDACGEAAIMRSEYMERCGASAEERYNYVDYAYRQWKGWKRAAQLANTKRQLTQPTFNAAITNTVALPDREGKIDLSARNISEITVDIWRVDVNGDYDFDRNIDKLYKQLKPHIVSSSRKTLTATLPGNPPYQQFKDSITLPAMPVGIYLIEVKTSDKSIGMKRMFYFVTDVFAMGQRLPNGKTRYAVVSATTGMPLPGAKLKLYTTYRRDKFVTLTCDEKGEAEYSGREVSGSVFAYTDKDSFRPIQSINASYYNHDNDNSRKDVTILTDRSIYRPGQTVNAVLLAFQRENHRDAAALAGATYEINLRDANYKVVETKKVTTDEYGKAGATFTLPSSGLTGHFTLQCDGGGWTSINVEEYKRPTFQIEMPTVEQQYAIGDTLTLKGKALTYSGIPVQGAKVKYTVKRKKAVWWWWSNGEEAVVNEGVATTDDNGEFEMTLPMVVTDKDKAAIAMGRHCYYRIVAEAEVTDQAGESHSATMAVPLSSKETYFCCTMPEQEEKESLKFLRFDLMNIAGKELTGRQVTWSIDNGAAQKAKTGEDIDISKMIKKLPSGKHTLNATCGDDKLEQEFIVFELTDKRAPVDTDDWFYQSTGKFSNDGTPVTIQVGASPKPTHILYTVVSAKGDLLENGCIDNKGEIINRQERYKEIYGDGVTLSYAWVLDGKMYTHTAQIEKPLPDKQLKLRWQTFRNRLEPGQQEEWTLIVETTDGKGTDASVAATLYDKSLDQIRKHQWGLSLGLYRHLVSMRWHGFHQRGSSVGGSSDIDYADVKGLSFSYFTTIDDFHYYPEVHIGMRRGGRVLMAQSKAAMPMAMGVDAMESNEIIHEEASFANAKMMAVPGEAADADAADEATTETEAPSEEDNEALDNASARTNFNETAFFFPTLTTDSKGQVALKFTLPESVTTWRLMAMANDKEMRNGMITDEAVAQKTVMVTPNMPRFVRTGDDATITARIANTSEKDLEGAIRMEISDTETEEAVVTQTSKCSLKGGQTTNATFNIDGGQLKPGKLYICKIVAAGKEFSDGEQHYLAVLPDRQRVTKTVPFTQTEAGVKEINIAEMIPATAEGDKRLTVEYTNNPMWLAIQALPTTAIGCKKNAISLAASYYSNKLAQFISQQTPDIKTTIEQWAQQEKENPGSVAMTSDLEQNEELKEMLLDETPWVMDADNETQQRHNLVKFFDGDEIDNRLATAMSHLKKLQNSDGSWSWWPGMRGSTYITLWVTEAMVRLNTLIGRQNDNKEMISKAFQFLDKEMIEQVELMKKAEKKGNKLSIFYWQINYLYALALDGREVTGKALEAKKYLLDKLMVMNRKRDIATKAMTAVVLAKNGKAKMADEYLQSIEEYSVYSEEMGRYYDSGRAFYSWCDYRIPTQVAAMEAMTVIGGREQTIDEMRRWLLQEKRTQGWDTPINTVDAVYALIHDNTKSLETKAETVLSLDGKQLEAPASVAGLGYVKTTADAEGAKVLKADKRSDGMSWGVAYVQFYQPTVYVDDAASGLKVERTIIADAPLKVGDKVTVRIDITADRDYDFVCVSDRRAACMEPTEQLSGYRNGYYITPRDNATNYYIDCLTKGKHRIETEYYIDRSGVYTTGTCEVQCSYSPGYKGTAKAMRIEVK